MRCASVRPVTGQLLDSGSVGAKQVSELQHELETLQRRQASLEEQQLEIMERREELQTQHAEELALIDALQGDLASAQVERDNALLSIDRLAARGSGSAACADCLIGFRARRDSMSGSGPRAAPVPGCCRADGVVPAGSKWTAVSWRGFRLRPRTTCCAARNVEQFCCGSRTCAGGAG